MKTLRFVLGDQLSHSLSSLKDIDKANDVVLMVEVREEATYVRHHKQKIVLVLAAMRHFADELLGKGLTVDYVTLNDAKNTGSFSAELKRALKRHQVDRVVVTEPSEWRVLHMMHAWSDELNIQLEIRDDDRFLCSHAEFSDWAKDRRTFRMEHFYQRLRRKTGWLMDGNKPAGGQWNYDSENRKKLPRDIRLPERKRFKADTVTQEIIDLVEAYFPGHFGELENFAWATTRKAAKQALKHFIEVCLPQFGDYQDAMKSGEDLLFHALLSPYLNIGLLLPGEVCEAALRAYETKHAPVAAVEGFVRQILGWREYVRGIYWLKMPDYAATNFLQAHRPLPAFYWTGDTRMHCMHEAISSSRRNAYAHHIQRLMVTGNFALLAGLSPKEVQEWYLIVYADAFEWVELPNTHGMVLHADHGLLASKPYAASGAYINRMSDYCQGCAYDHKIKLGDDACPFNYLYWYFLINNEKHFKTNARMAMPYRNLARMDDQQRAQIMSQSEIFLQDLYGTE